MVDGDERVWHGQVGRRVPAADRNVRYRPAAPALIAARTPYLEPPTLANVEAATLALRTADEKGGTGASAVPLLRTESAASSKIEQIEVGQRYVGRALAGLPTRQRSALEVAHNVAALQAAVQMPLENGITAEMLHEAHRILLPDEEWAGTPRTQQNWIGGSDYSPRDARYVPPEHERVPELMTDLAGFASRNDVPALAQAAIAHAQFEVIHPYADGNGRIGRALAHMILRRRGVVVNGIAPLSVAVLADQEAYLTGLQDYQRGDLDRWVTWFAEAGAKAALASRQLQTGLTALQEEWARLPEVEQARSDAAVRRLVFQLIEHPVCSAQQAAERLGVSRRAARDALEALTDVGVLNRTTAARNLQVYEASEVFALIDDLERTFVDGIAARGMSAGDRSGTSPTL